jgi:hypothetical protein
MNGGVPSCRHCGETGNKAGAKFCMSCGKSMAPEPVSCPSCGQVAPVATAKFCNSCGAPLSQTVAAPPPPPPEIAPEPVVEAPAPEPAPKGRPVAALVKVLLLLVVIGGAFAAYWHFLRIPEPKLLVWSDDPALEIKVQAGIPVARDAQGSYAPAAGPCVVTVSRQGQVIETHKFTIRPGASHLCVVGGAPVDVKVDGLPDARLRSRHSWPGAVYFCEPCKRIDMAARCAGCAKEVPPLSPKKTLTVSKAASLAEGGPDERALILANPYAADLSVTAQTPACSISFPLPKESIRALPHAESISLKCSIAPDGPVLDERDLKAAPGVSLYTVGGATWFEWMREDGSPVPQGRVQGDFLSVVPLEAGTRLLPPEPGKPGLLRKEAAGKIDRLVSIVSLPILPPLSIDARKMTVRPGVEISEITLTGALAGKTVESLAAGDAGIIVVADGAAYALSSGERLHDPGPGVTSAALASDGLFLLTRQATCATLDGRKIVLGPSVGDPTFRAWAPRDGGTVYLVGGRFNSGLFQVTPEGLREILPAVPEVTGLGNSKEGLLVARGRTLDRMTVVNGSAKLDALLVLPAGPSVIGLHDAGGPLVFATESAVYMLADNIVMPLVHGVGGTLYPCKGGILLHDRASRRLFRLTSAFFKEM